MAIEMSVSVLHLYVFQAEDQLRIVEEQRKIHEERMKLEQERQKQQKEEQKMILGKGKSRPRLSFTLKATEWFLLSSILFSSLDVCFMLKWIGGSLKERSALSTQTALS